LRRIVEKYPDVAGKTTLYANQHLVGVEKSERMVRIAKTDMLLHGDGHSSILRMDALLPFENYRNLQANQFDLVMTNPPFGSVLGPEAMLHLGRFALAASGRPVPLEILGLERSVQFLKPGGRIGIVLPEGIMSNVRLQHVRDWLADNLRILGVVSLPIETFNPFGANVKTSVLLARKWRPGEDRRDYDIFLGRVDDVGYDSTGRARGKNELPALARKFLSFFSEADAI
jgi:type I restriction enzyme M protein